MWPRAVPPLQVSVPSVPLKWGNDGALLLGWISERNCKALSKCSGMEGALMNAGAGVTVSGLLLEEHH